MFQMTISFMTISHSANLNDIKNKKVLKLHVRDSYQVRNIKIFVYNMYVQI